MKHLRTVFFTVVIMGLISCTPTKTLVDTSCPGYRSSDFSRNQISVGKIGIMPVLGGAEKEQFRRPMANKLNFYFSQTFGSGNVMSTQNVVNVLNDNNLAEDYYRALETYRLTGIIPKDLVMSLGEALGVEFLLYTSLLGSSEVDFISTGNSYQKVQTDEIYIQTQVWSTAKGDVVWEGKGGIAKLSNYDGDMIDLTAKGLADVVGNGPNQGPCEQPATLFQSAQQAVTNTYLAVSLVALLALIPIYML